MTDTLVGTPDPGDGDDRYSLRGCPPGTCGICWPNLPRGPFGFRMDPGTIRTFDTGATRDTEEGKLDFEGFLSPRVLLRFAEYMHEHRKQSDGELRDGDNWQKGIPKDAYMKSMWRHFMDVWLMHRGMPQGHTGADMETALCAVIFNAMGMLYNTLEGLE